MTPGTAEVLLTGRVADLAPIVTALGRQPALLLGEHVPTRWMGLEEGRRGLRFEQVTPGASPTLPTRGRLFCEAYELRWEPAPGSAQEWSVRYLGAPRSLPSLAPAPEVNPADLEPHELGYDLWGEVVADPTALGEPATARVYAELRLPRLLHYPVNGRPRRVRVRVREYRAAGTGVLVLARFCGLEEEEAS
jgi:hypothetical protein